MNEAKADSNEVLESNDQFLPNFIRHLWMDNTPEEAYSIWKRDVQISREGSTNALNQLAGVLENPPSDLIEILQTQGWISIMDYTENSSEPVPGSYEEHLEWLRKMNQTLLQIYHETAK